MRASHRATVAQSHEELPVEHRPAPTTAGIHPRSTSRMSPSHTTGCWRPPAPNRKSALPTTRRLLTRQSRTDSALCVAPTSWRPPRCQPSPVGTTEPEVNRTSRGRVRSQTSCGVVGAGAEASAGTRRWCRRADVGMCLRRRTARDREREERHFDDAERAGRPRVSGRGKRTSRRLVGAAQNAPSARWRLVPRSRACRLGVRSAGGRSDTPIAPGRLGGQRRWRARQCRRWRAPPSHRGTFADSNRR